MSTKQVESTQEERFLNRRRRSQRYHPLMEPMMLPEGFVETVHRILGSYVHELRSAISWLDQEIGLPLTARARHRIPDAKSWSAGLIELSEPEIAELEQRLGISYQAPNLPHINPKPTPHQPRTYPTMTP